MSSNVARICVEKLRKYSPMMEKVVKIMAKIENISGTTVSRGPWEPKLLN